MTETAGAPLLSLAVTPNTAADRKKLGRGLAWLMGEDPTLAVRTDPASDEVVILAMGEQHLEVVVDRLKREFEVNAAVGRPTIVYRETVTRRAGTHREVTLSRRRAVASDARPPAARAREILGWLERRGSKRNRDGMARYAIVAPKSFGVSVATIRELSRRAGRSHELAEALWQTGWYEARMMAPFVDEPARVTAAQMDRWARDFDNWAICDALCFHLFDRTPHAWRKIEQWSRRREEFVRRAAFALLASVALHDKTAPDGPFLRALPLIERAATDGRNFVKKGVSWALRSVGRRNAALNAAAVNVARRLADSSEAAPRWVGKDALRELTSPAVRRRLE